MSGYTDHAIVHHGIVNRDLAFLGKPFAPVALTRKVRETLRLGRSANLVGPTEFFGGKSLEGRFCTKLI